MWKIIFGILSLASLFWGFDCSGGAKVHVNKAWVKMTPASNTPAALYFTITNDSDEPDTLLAITSEEASKVEIRQTLETAGTPVTNTLAKVVIKPGETVTFTPDGMHGVINALKQDLIEGEEITFHLIFDKASSIAVDALIESPSATVFRRSNN